MEERKLTVSFFRPGGTASKGALSAKIALPTSWLNIMGINKERKKVIVNFDGECIEIRRVEDAEQLEADAP